ncbi:hypothetical protein L2E82_29370 [Cichorium intybus]|uniref:Uncharacterized protein n=1 Tax=Cichorium intybus TaxID=13427 RepID=A0ACB9CXP4_CICIN|nr:hypothetical protein L2E82_29370 [Cichorium intybus]
MMGYANSDQTASGIHFRLRARAFIIAEPQGNRVVFVNLDACMASQLVTIKVLERLKASHLVDGIEQSIIRAQENLHPGSVFVNRGINTDLQKDQKDDTNNLLKEPRHKLEKRRKYENLMK